MAGGSLNHALLTSALIAILHAQLRGKDCRIGSGDLRIFVPETGLYAYPDATVFCGKPLFLDNSSDTLMNPVMIVEVLSPSTEAYDRGRKFQHYREIDTLRHYLLMSQDRVNVELFTKECGRWVVTSANTIAERLRIEAIGCEIPVGELYEGMEFVAG